jgi:hypothetical protein
VDCANDVPARPSKARPSVMEAMSFLMLMVFVLWMWFIDSLRASRSGS